jgi:hypothetical protein
MAGQIRTSGRRIRRHRHDPLRRKKQEQIELLELGKSGIHVAEYLTDSLPKEVLQEKLHKAIANARKRLENQGKELDAENVVKLMEGE